MMGFTGLQFMYETQILIEMLEYEFCKIRKEKEDWK